MKKKKPKVPDYNKMIFHPETYKKMGPLGIINLCDELLKMSVAYLKKAGRRDADMREMFIQYGRASRAMNIEVRKIIKEMSTPPNPLTGTEQNPLTKEDLKEVAAPPTMEDPHFRLLFQWKIAYAYWWNRTQYLETFQKSFLGGVADRNSINNGAQRLREWALMEAKDLEKAKKNISRFTELIERLAGKTELTEIEIQEVFDGKEVDKNYDEEQTDPGREETTPTPLGH